MEIRHTRDAKNIVDAFGGKINLDEVMEAWVFRIGWQFALRMKDGRLRIVFCEKNYEEIVTAVKKAMEPCLIGMPSPINGTYMIVREEYVKIIDIPRVERCHEVIARTKSGEEVLLFRGYTHTSVRFYNNLMKEHPVLRNPLTMIFFGCPRSEKRS